MLRALVVTKRSCMYCEALAEGVHDLESLLLCKLACKLMCMMHAVNESMRVWRANDGPMAVSQTFVDRLPYRTSHDPHCLPPHTRTLPTYMFFHMFFHSLTRASFGIKSCGATTPSTTMTTTPSTMRRAMLRGTRRATRLRGNRSARRVSGEW